MAQKLFTKNFSLLVAGQASSLFGNYILKLALSMYVLDVTGSAAIFAGILSVALVPTILLSPLGGILADRSNKKNIMVALDTLTGLSVLCAALLLSESSGLMVVTVLLIALSILGAFETPTVQACVPQMQTGDNIVRGNAVVNQVSAVAALIAPLLGGVLYAALGIKPVMLASVTCFFITALFECFIKMNDRRPVGAGITGGPLGILSIVKDDLSLSLRFICREQPGILKILLLAALASFFVIGTAMVGFPYIVRAILGLNAEYYGAAESLIGVAAILGSAAAGLLTGKLKMRRLSLVYALLGASLVPAGIIFLLPSDTISRYVITTASFCGVQMAACIFSIFALSYVQQKTPNYLIGKVMAYISTITMCAQPFGQIIYGFLFDRLSDKIYLVLIPSGAVICLTGLSAAGFFKSLEHA